MKLYRKLLSVEDALPCPVIFEEMPSSTLEEIFDESPLAPEDFAHPDLAEYCDKILIKKEGIPEKISQESESDYFVDYLESFQWSYIENIFSDDDSYESPCEEPGEKKDPEKSEEKVLSFEEEPNEFEEAA